MNYQTAAQMVQQGHNFATQDGPKEIGILQRVEGLRGGLDEFLSRLTDFEARLAGGPEGKPGNAEPMPTGLRGNLSAAEAKLRDCALTLERISGVF